MKTRATILLACLLGSILLEVVNAQTEKGPLPLSERLPPKIQKIQEQLPAWIEKGGNKEKAMALMQKLKEHLDAKNFEEADKTADSILETIGGSAPAATQGIPVEARKKLVHDLGGSFLVFRNDKVQDELKLTKEQKEKLEQHLRELLSGRHAVFPEYARPEAERNRERTPSLPQEDE